MYYLKKALIGLVYLVFAGLMAYAILFIPNLEWLKIILLALNLGLYCYVLGATSYQDGQAAYKVRLANDLKRKQIILTGEDIPIDRKREYKAYKGVIIGAIICVPLVVLLILNLILTNTNYDLGATASFLYLFVYAFAGVGVQVDNLFTVVSPYWALLAIPIIVAVDGLFFYLGGRKIELQQEMIKEKHRMLHGE